MNEASSGVLGRWWIYQRERFPVFAHGVLIAAFSFSAVSFSALLRSDSAVPAWPAIMVAFATSFLSFLQLRLADEFKDFEEDSRFRSYRPVPRGLVTLRELGGLWVATAVIQLALAIWIDARLLLLLLVTWTYLALMSHEFFARHWLKARPVTYLWTHMLIMPLIDLYATACDWMPTGAGPSRGLLWFLIVSFFNGIVIEIGRKIRAPEDEEPGVETYSFLWGRRNAVRLWLAMLAITAGCALLAARAIEFVWPVAAGLGVLLLLALAAAIHFLRNPKAGSGKRFEMVAGLWTLCMYLLLGAAPILLRLLK